MTYLQVCFSLRIAIKGDIGINGQLDFLFTRFPLCKLDDSGNKIEITVIENVNLDIYICIQLKIIISKKKKKKNVLRLTFARNDPYTEETAPCCPLL